MHGKIYSALIGTQTRASWFRPGHVINCVMRDLKNFSENMYISKHLSLYLIPYVKYYYQVLTALYWSHDDGATRRAALRSGALPARRLRGALAAISLFFFLDGHCR